MGHSRSLAYQPCSAAACMSDCFWLCKVEGELHQGRLNPSRVNSQGLYPPVPVVRHLGHPQVPLLGWLRPVQPALKLLVELLYDDSGPTRGTLRGCGSGEDRDVVQRVRLGGAGRVHSGL